MKHSQWIWLLYLALFVALTGRAATEDESKIGAGLYLAKIKVHAAQGIDFAQQLSALSADQEPALPLRIALHGAADTDGLSAMLEQTDVAFGRDDSDQLVVEITATSRFGGEPTASHGRATWVVDYEQPSVQALLQGRRAQTADDEANLGVIDANTDPDAIAGLIEFSGDQITNVNYRNGFQIASQVAKRQEGDCSEHAVLQTAFARAEGYPARVILGLMLAISGGELEAWGHAWSEIHDGEGWVLADSTRPLRHVDAVYYLPVMELKNEGTGHIMEVFRFSQLRPSEVTLLGP